MSTMIGIRLLVVSIEDDMSTPLEQDCKTAIAELQAANIPFTVTHVPRHVKHMFGAPLLQIGDPNVDGESWYGLEGAGGIRAWMAKQKIAPPA